MYHRNVSSTYRHIRHVSGSFLSYLNFTRLATLGEITHTLTSQVLQSDTFVNDILTRTDSIQLALNIQNKLIDLHSSGFFYSKNGKQRN